MPSHWAGVYQVWGRENREAALRLVTGSTGEHDVRANLEVKCFDLAANPYLVIGSLLAAGLAGTGALPDEVAGDPAALGEDELSQRGIVRLPQSLDAAADAFEASGVLREAMGDPLFEAILAVRRGETVLFDGHQPGRRGGAHSLAMVTPGVTVAERLSSDRRPYPSRTQGRARAAGPVSGSGS